MLHRGLADHALMLPARVLSTHPQMLSPRTTLSSRTILLLALHHINSSPRMKISTCSLSKNSQCQNSLNNAPPSLASAFSGNGRGSSLKNYPSYPTRPPPGRVQFLVGRKRGFPRAGFSESSSSSDGTGLAPLHHDCLRGNVDRLL